MNRPKDLHRALTEERLAEIVAAMRAATAAATRDFNPAEGDDEWSLGCVSFVRRRSRICALSNKRPWLEIVSAKPEFVFSIEGVPIKHYRGDPEEPPVRAFARRPREILAIQQVFPEMPQAAQPLDRMLRLIIVTDQRRQLAEAYLLQLDEQGVIHNRWRLPTDGEAQPLTYDAAPEPFDPGPAKVRSRAAESEAEEDGQERAAGL